MVKFTKMEGEESHREVHGLITAMQAVSVHQKSESGYIDSHFRESALGSCAFKFET